MFLNDLKKCAVAVSTSMKPKCPKRKKNPSKPEPNFLKRSSRLSVKDNLGSSKHDVIPCNFNQGNLLKGIDNFLGAALKTAEGQIISEFVKFFHW